MTFSARGDADVLQRFRDGEQSALDAVYRTYVDSVARNVAGTVRRCCNWRVVAADLPDLVQEVFARAFDPKARWAFDGVRQYGAYLNQIARNVVVDHLRRRQKQVVPFLGPFLEEVSARPSPHDEADELADPETVERVHLYVAGLPADLRQVYEALYVQGLSQRDVAAALGRGRQVVRTLEARLREGLRFALGEMGIVESTENRARAGSPPSSLDTASPPGRSDLASI